MGMITVISAALTVLLMVKNVKVIMLYMQVLAIYLTHSSLITLQPIGKDSPLERFFAYYQYLNI